MASENKYDIATLQALYQADLAKYQTISESNTSLDTKNGLLIGAIIAVGVFIFQDPLFAKATGDCTPFGYFLFSLLLIIGTLLLIPGPQFPDRKVVGCMAFPPSSLARYTTAPVN